MKKTIRLMIQIASICILLFATSTIVQSQSLPRLNKQFPDFTFTDHNGEEIALSEMKGKKVILIFPRGKVGDHWCQLCHYQYAELAELEMNEKFRDKYNVEVIFILPYPMDEVRLWVDMFPSQMADIQGWKNIPDERLTARWIPFIEAIKEILPNDYVFDEDNPAPLPFSILSDADHSFSSDMKLFSTSWDGYYNEQNEPTTFILDEDGIVRFKYKSQETFDRPNSEYLIKYIDQMMD